MNEWIVVGGTEKERLNKSEVLAVHAALLHTGHILYFGGDEHDPARNVRGRTDRSVLHTARLFDCSTNEVSTVQQLNTDVFCCGHAFLEDGRLIVAGGTGSFNETEEDVLMPRPPFSPHGHFSGLPNTFIFDPTSLTWLVAGNMRPRPRQDNGGRWYPTLVTLPDGNVLAMSGHPHESDRFPSPNEEDHKHTMPEIFYPSSSALALGRWVIKKELGDAGQSDYPRLHVIDGFENEMQVFTSSTLFGGDNHCYVFNPYNTGMHQAVCNLVDSQGNPLDGDGIYFGYHCTSVLLPLLPEEGYRPRILLFGGARALIIDPLSQNWRYTAARRLQSSPRRIDANSVILPTGEVFFCGGVSEPNDDVRGANFANEGMRAVLRGEIYDPKRDLWTTTDSPAQVIRTYHSVALLMPDGRVWTAGSNKNGNYSYSDYRRFYMDNLIYANNPNWRTEALAYRRRALVDGRDDPNPSVRHRELRIEIFEPWYCAIPDRPRIVPPIPTHIRWGEEFKIGFESSRVIRSAAMIRASSVTHAFNSDQRYVGLVIEEISQTLKLRAPPRSTIAPPGYYLLFILDENGDENGIPSMGSFVRLSELPSVPTIEREIRDLVEWGVEEPDPVTYLKTIKDIDKPLSQDKNKALQQIADIRKQLTDQFENGKIEKSAFDALDKAISKYTESKGL